MKSYTESDSSDECEIGHKQPNLISSKSDIIHEIQAKSIQEEQMIDEIMSYEQMNDQSNLVLEPLISASSFLKRNQCLNQIFDCVSRINSKLGIKDQSNNRNLENVSHQLLNIESQLESIIDEFRTNEWLNEWPILDKYEWQLL